MWVTKTLFVFFLWWIIYLIQVFVMRVLHRFYSSNRQFANVELVDEIELRKRALGLSLLELPMLVYAVFSSEF